MRIRFYDDTITAPSVSHYQLAPMLSTLRPFIAGSTYTGTGHRHASGVSKTSFWLDAPVGRCHDILISAGTGSHNGTPVETQPLPQATTLPRPLPRLSNSWKI
eukprot:9104746-Karenia_brevis.AAC.1